MAGAIDEHAVLVERLKNLQDDLVKIDQGVSSLNDKFGCFERGYLVEHAKVVNRADEAHARLADHLKRIEMLEARFEQLSKLISPLIQTNKIVVWIGGALGLSVLGLVWSILTGQVTLLFK